MERRKDLDKDFARGFIDGLVVLAVMVAVIITIVMAVGLPRVHSAMVASSVQAAPAAKQATIRCSEPDVHAVGETVFWTTWSCPPIGRAQTLVLQIDVKVDKERTNMEVTFHCHGHPPRVIATDRSGSYRRVVGRKDGKTWSNMTSTSCSLTIRTTKSAVLRDDSVTVTR